MYRRFSYFFCPLFLLGLSKIRVSPVCVYLTVVSERTSSLSHSAEREGLRPGVLVRSAVEDASPDLQSGPSASAVLPALRR